MERVEDLSAFMYVNEYIYVLTFTVHVWKNMFPLAYLRTSLQVSLMYMSYCIYINGALEFNSESDAFIFHCI
jgi:hypothetical protein